MNSDSLTRRLYLPACLTLLVFLVPVVASGQAMRDTVSAKHEYQQKLANLTTQLENEGYEINQLVKDERFEVYGGIGDRFKNSAERTTPTLDEYKEIIDFENKVHQGLTFMKDHEKQLEKAENEYGIPKSLITAIIGIESKYGQVLGSYNPFNVYISMMAVDYRADFAEAQLKELLEFVNRKEIDVFTLKSSYAGAMSSAQFIPYSVNKWWVGKDIDNIDNSILSVANYLAYFKERTNSLSTAVIRYNPSTLYRDAVLDLADALEKAYQTQP